MKSVDPVYERGFMAGKNGATEKDNPYPKKVSSIAYVLTNHDVWEDGRQDGIRCCPCCNGTGKITIADIQKLKE